MEFFKKKDISYYKQVLDEKITSKSPNWFEVRTALTTNGVFGKTKFWTDSFNDLGYTAKSRNDCQYSGKLRTYTWGRICLNGFEDSKVYYTVGVGSRLSESSDDLDLLVKIDCHRKDLAPFQIQSFDKYRDSVLRDWIIEIKQEELPKYTWDSLIQKTQGFIERNKEHYKELVKIIWPNGLEIKPKVARLCWNDLGWEKPSGLEGKSKNTNHTFESKGYGHEEWLFDLNRGIEGYHYGFIQAFNKGNHFGKTYDLHLYTLKREGNKSNCYWVGRIKDAQVLTQEEQKEVFELYQNKGWYPEMMKELKEVGVKHRDLEIVSKEELFNVKFKIDSDSFTKFDEPKFIENPKRDISKGYSRYNLKDLITTTATVSNTSGNYKFTPGHNPTKIGISKSIYSKKTVNRTLKHKEIQEYMYHQLAQKYDEKSVGTEVPTGRGTSIDVVVVQSDMTEWFYEVKTYNQPLVCIREAFGQILEYAMFSKNRHAKKLIVVGVNKPSRSEVEYLKHLRSITNLNIYYQVFSLEDMLLSEKLY